MHNIVDVYYNIQIYKGIKQMRAYSQDLRDRVIALYSTNQYTKLALTKIFKLSYQTVLNWIKRFEELNDYSSRQHIQTGRSAIFTDKQSVLEFLVANPDSRGSDIRDAVAPEMPMSTFYDTLRRMQITYKKKSQNILDGMKQQGKNL